jgi:hypothetical protein
MWPFKRTTETETGKTIFTEHMDGKWELHKYDHDDKLVSWEHSRGDLREYDQYGNEVYWSDGDKKWERWEYDEKGNLIYWDNSNGEVYHAEYNESGNKIFEARNGVILLEQTE